MLPSLGMAITKQEVFLPCRTRGKAHRPLCHKALIWSFGFLVFSLGLSALVKVMRMEGLGMGIVLGLSHLAQVYWEVILGSGGMKK